MQLPTTKGHYNKYLTNQQNMCHNTLVVGTQNGLEYYWKNTRDKANLYTYSIIFTTIKVH